MGRSRTVNVLIYGKESDDIRQYRTAMNRLEVLQQIHILKKEGKEIDFFYAQTKIGEKILFGNVSIGYREFDKRNYLKTVTCPICEGEGHNDKYYCPVCNGSGITVKGNEKRWQDWQLEDMKQERKGVVR